MDKFDSDELNNFFENYIKKHSLVKKIIISTQSSKEIVEHNELMYVEVNKHNIIYHLKDRKIMSYGSLTIIASELEKVGFAKCSSRHLVNLSLVTAINESQEVILSDIKLPLSRAFKKSFLGAMSNYVECII